MNSIIRSFWQNLRSSFYNPSFYASLPKSRTFWNGFWFLFVIVIIDVALTFFPSAIKSLKSVRDFSIESTVEKYYPDDLVIHISKGEVETNVEVPYTIPYPNEIKTNSDPSNILVIDNSRELSLSDIANFDSALILTKSGLVLNQKNEQRIFQLNDIEDLIINEQEVTEWATKLFGWLKILVIPFVLAASIFVSAATMLWTMVGLIVFAIITLIMLRIKSRPETFSDSYTISMFALAPALVIETVLSFFGIQALSFVYKLLLFIIVLVLNIKKPDPQA